MKSRNRKKKYQPWNGEIRLWLTKEEEGFFERCCPTRQRYLQLGGLRNWSSFVCGYVLQKMTNRWKPWALKTDGGPKKLTRGPLEMMFDRDMAKTLMRENIIFKNPVFLKVEMQRIQYKWSIDWFDLWYGLTHTIRHFSSYIAKVLCVKCNLKNLEWLPVQFESIHPS